MYKTAIALVLCSLISTAVHAAAPPPVDLDLANKTATITVKADTSFNVRLIHTVLNREYRTPEGAVFVRSTEAKGTLDDANCSQKNLAAELNTAKTETDVVTAITKAVEKCSDLQKKSDLEKFGADQTAITLPSYTVELGKSVTITIKDLAATPWVFKLAADKTTLVTFDLSRKTDQVSVPAGDVKIQLKNALIETNYRQLPAGAKRRANPSFPGTSTDCVAEITKKLKELKEEKEATIPLTLPQCVPEKLVALVKENGAAWQTIDFESDTITAGETRVYKIVRLNADEMPVDGAEWAFKVIGKEERKQLTAADHPKLDEQRALTEKSPTLTTLRCSYKDEFCTGEAIYANADQISTVYISDIEPGEFTTVRITAGESFKHDGAGGCKELNYNYRVFADAPDRLVFPITMKGGWAGLKSVRWAPLIEEAARQYGVDCGDEINPVQDPRPGQPSDDPVIPLVLRGKSSVLTIQTVRAGKIKTFTIPIRYQRFWLDAGGFFAFARVNDQFLVKDPNPPSDKDPTLVRILARKNNASVRPATGIVLNVHPGNRPIYAFQFGIAAAENRLPSYYLGIAVRARELGRRALATLGAGVALQQEDLYPFVHEDDIRRLDDPALTATRRYAFQPYISFAFGFSFGGVSEKTDVSASVTSTK